MPTSLTDRLATISDADIRWTNAVRIIAGQYPPIVGFERIGAPDEFDALLALERETQPRVAASDATISHLTFPRRATGPGAGFVMPTFTRISPDGSRFAPPGSFGVYYAGLDEATAVEETIYHTERVAAATGEADQLFMRRMLVADIVAMLADFRGQQDAFPDVYDPDNYSVGQAAGRLSLELDHARRIQLEHPERTLGAERGIRAPGPRPARSCGPRAPRHQADRRNPGHRVSP